MTFDSSHDAATVMYEDEQLTLSAIAPLKAELLKHLESNEEDSDVLREIERVLLEDLPDRYSDQDTPHTSKPRLYIFLMISIIPCLSYLVIGSECVHMCSNILFSF